MFFICCKLQIVCIMKLFIFLFFSLLNTSNETLIRVVDSNTKEPIPYATVNSRNLYRVTNMYGQLQLPCDADSISVRCVGYEQQDLRIRDIKSEKGEFTIYLTPKNYTIDEVRITPTRIKKIQLGYFRQSSSSIYQSSWGGQIALYFPPDERNKLVRLPIGTVSYFIRAGHNPKKRFRVRLYSVNASNGSPSEDLLPEAVYASAKSGNNWVKVDVRKYNIQFPSDGFFAALEFLPDSIQLTKDQLNTQFNSLDLGGNVEDKNNGRTWGFGDSGRWRKYIPITKDVEVGNAMIKVELYKEEVKK